MPKGSLESDATERFINSRSGRYAVTLIQEPIVGLVATIATIIVSAVSLAYWLGRKLERIEGCVRRIEERITRVSEASRSQLEFFAEFLGFRGILEAKDVMFVKGELTRLSAMAEAINPVTKEDAKRLKELIEKEKLTLQEADELREIAQKYVEEYGHVRGEVWKLLIYASILRGIALREV